ncbi:hypothetical protein DV736_g529, partial [Chaetothyriales sp. CBS 134916]
MSTWVYPPIPAEEQRRAEDEALQLELQWLLRSLQGALPLLKEGLEECASLLAPREPGSTLVLSSLRSENVKGFVTRVGTKIVKGDIHLRLTTLLPNTPRTQTASSPSTRLTLTPSPSAPDLVLPQLFAVRSLINDSLDVIDVSRWSGEPTDASFISGQLKLLHDHLRDARAYMKGIAAGEPLNLVPGGEWWLHSVQPEVFEPQLPDLLSLHFTIQDANIVLTIRTLAPTSPGCTPSTPAESPFSLSGFSLRDKLLGLVSKPPNHDEMGEIFEWRGRTDVAVREKARVETGDPSLMSVAAKLSALEHEVDAYVFGNHECEIDLVPVQQAESNAQMLNQENEQGWGSFTATSSISFRDKCPPFDRFNIFVRTRCDAIRPEISLRLPSIQICYYSFSECAIKIEGSYERGWDQTSVVLRKVRSWLRLPNGVGSVGGCTAGAVILIQVTMNFFN